MYHSLNFNFQTFYVNRNIVNLAEVNATPIPFSAFITQCVNEFLPTEAGKES